MSDVVAESAINTRRPLFTKADVRVDDALLELFVVTAEIERDPDWNWKLRKGDFEKAVTGVREAFAAKQSEKPVEPEVTGPERFLSFGERAALKRLVGHFDDGLFVRGTELGPWQDRLEATARRLGFYDPFGSRSVRISNAETDAIENLYLACKRQIASGELSDQMKSDASTIGLALGRTGPPVEPRMAEAERDSEGKGRAIRF